MYDTSQEVVLVGTVVAFEWAEPHTWTRVRVVDRYGSDAIWSLEGMSPAYLGRRGWNRHSLQQGDRIEVTVYPRRNGTNGGMFVRATLPDGTLKVMADVSR